MPKFRETRKQLLYSRCDNLIIDGIFIAIRSLVLPKT